MKQRASEKHLTFFKVKFAARPTLTPRWPSHGDTVLVPRGVQVDRRSALGLAGSATTESHSDASQSASESAALAYIRVHRSKSVKALHVERLAAL
eukprot:3762606-Rhodomonas_salina.3